MSAAENSNITKRQVGQSRTFSKLTIIIFIIWIYLVGVEKFIKSTEPTLGRLVVQVDRVDRR